MIRQLALCGLLAVSLPLNAAQPSRGEVLVVVSSEHHLDLKDGKTYATGYYLNELATPVKRLIEAGYTPVFANPKGNTPPMDVHSNDKMFFGGDDKKRQEARRFVEGLEGLRKPRTLASVAAEGTQRYAGIFLPGGHAPMQDLVKDVNLGGILREFHGSKRPTALICHAPATLLSAMSDPGAYLRALAKGDDLALAKLSEGWPYVGYRMTVFSTAEERAVEPGQLKGQVPYYPAEALAEAGAQVENAGRWKAEVVQDRELITGQQPFSDERLAELFIKALNTQTSARRE